MPILSLIPGILDEDLGYIWFLMTRVYFYCNLPTLKLLNI